MSSFLSFVRSFGLLIARLGVGGLMILHGYVRWREQGIPAQITFLQQFGTPYPEVAAWTATIFELVGGVFLIVGALTPLVGLGILIQQVLTISYTNYSKSWNLLNTDGSYNGGFEYNVALGQRRAEAVMKTLVLLGVDAKRIEPVSFGEEKPRCTSHDESCWAQNRRGDITF